MHEPNRDAKNRTRRFTPAQRRALEWLPADGSWRHGAGRLTAALNSLSIYHRDLCEGEWVDAGPRGGRVLRFRRRDIANV